MQYIKDGFTLPVPFNLIPVPASIFKLIKKCFKSIKEKRTKESVNQIGGQSQIQVEEITKNIDDSNGNPISTKEPNNINTKPIKEDDKTNKTNYSVVENQKLTYRVN